MTERATIFQGVQIGVEATPGTAVAANKALQSLSIESAVEAENLPFRPMGQKFLSLVVPNKEWASAAVSGPMTYTEIIYPLASVLAYTAPVQQGGTAAYLWSFLPDINDPDTVKTYTVEVGGKVRAHRFTNGIFTALNLKYSRDALEVSGEMIGDAITDDIQMSTNAQYTLTAGSPAPTSGNYTLTYATQTTGNIAFDATAAAVQAALVALSNIGTSDVVVTATTATGTGKLDTAGNVYTIEFRNDLGRQPITLTATFTGLSGGTIALASTVTGVVPTILSLKPILPTQTQVFAADTYAGLPGSALERVLSVEWDIANRHGPLWALNSADGYGFATTIETEPDLTLKVKMEADATGMALLTKMRAGDTKFWRIVSTGELIASSYYYKLQIDFAGKVQEVSKFEDADGVYAIEWTFGGVVDPTWGYATQIQVINEQTAL